MSLTYNLANPYSFNYCYSSRGEVSRQNILYMSKSEQDRQIDIFNKMRNATLRHFDDFEKISKDMYNNLGEINDDILNIWKTALKVLYASPGYHEQIDKIVDPWDDKIVDPMEHNFVEIYMYDNSLHLDIYEFKGYELYDIYSHPGDNQFGVILLKYDSQYFPIFRNHDTNLINCKLSIDDTGITSLISLIQGYNMSFQNKRIANIPSVLTEIDKLFISDVYGEKMTTLMESSCTGLIDVVKFLVENNANVNIRNSEGLTAAHYAYMNDHMDIFYYLIHSGTDLQSIDDNGNNFLLLMYYDSSVDFKLAKFLIDRTNNLDHQNNEGCNMLMLCINDYETVEYLINRRSDIHTKNNLGQTALDIAIEDKVDERIINLLRENM